MPIREHREEAGQSPRVLVPTGAPGTELGGVLVDEIVGDQAGHRVGIVAAEGSEVGAGDVDGRSRRQPQTSRTFS